MSNQEMQFADPDWEPTRPGQQAPAYTPQPVNENRREGIQQPIVETPPVQEEIYGGYAGAQPEQFRQPTYRYPQRPYRRRRRGAWLWIIVAILLISLMSGGASALGGIGQRSVTEAHPFNTQFAGTPTIIINESDGNIHVDRGSSLSIEDTKNSSFFDDPNNIKVTFNQTGDTITVNVDTGNGFLSSRSVDFNITVPDSANLQLATNSGDISVNNTSGDMSLTTSSGDISTINDTFDGNAVLRTSSGDIQSRQDVFNGEAGLSSDSGDISMNQDTLNSSAKVNSSSGDINFTGTISSATTPDISYQFTTDSGDIHISLPADANFSVQADTGSGSIDTGAFSTISVQDAHQGSSNHASGNVGSAPGPLVNIGTDSGDITIHQR